MKRTIAIFSLFLLALSGTFAQSTTPTVSDVLENVLTSVVTVSVEKTSETKQILGFRGPSDMAYEKILDLSNSRGSGSGFIIEKNGKKYVVTNAHVIEDAEETKGSVFIYSINRTKYEARVVGGDSFYDIAVLEFVGTPGTEVKPITFAAKEPRIGEQVYAVGNPLGEYPYTVSEGIISAKNRIREGLTGKFGFLQTTATIIWGNSGGPLVNNKGQVVGINSQIAFAKRSDESIWQPQINFALEGILSNRLVSDIIINNGRVKRAYFGVEFTQESEYNEYSTTSKDGWEVKDSLPVITGVIPGSPAETLLRDKIGYQLVKIGNTTIRNTEEALGEFETAKPGVPLKLTLRKDSLTEVVDITGVELTPVQNEAIAKFAMGSFSNFKIVLLGDIPYISFINAETEIDGTPGKSNSSDIIGEKQRGEAVSSGTWEITAGGYEETGFSSIWRIKSLADLGAALRLTASLGAIDLYLVRKGGRSEDMQSTRISFSGGNETRWLKRLWY